MSGIKKLRTKLLDEDDEMQKAFKCPCELWPSQELKDSFSANFYADSEGWNLYEGHHNWEDWYSFDSLKKLSNIGDSTNFNYYEDFDCSQENKLVSDECDYEAFESQELLPTSIGKIKNTSCPALNKHKFEIELQSSLPHEQDNAYHHSMPDDEIEILLEQNRSTQLEVTPKRYISDIKGDIDRNDDTFYTWMHFSKLFSGSSNSTLKVIQEVDEYGVKKGKEYCIERGKAGPHDSNNDVDQESMSLNSIMLRNKINSKPTKAQIFDCTVDKKCMKLPEDKTYQHMITAVKNGSHVADRRKWLLNVFASKNMEFREPKYNEFNQSSDFNDLKANDKRLRHNSVCCRKEEWEKKLAQIEAKANPPKLNARINWKWSKDGSYKKHIVLK